MNPRSLSLLIGCNLIWSFHPLFAKLALESFTPAQASWLRYTSAAIAYLLVAAVTQIKPGTTKPQIFARPQNPRDAGLIALLGLAPFAFSPILQFSGLAHTQAIDNAIIIAMEPVMTVVLAWIVLGERLRWVQWLSFGVAIVGFLLLSGARWDHLVTGNFEAVLPFALMLMALWGEAVYSVFGRKLGRNYSALPLFGSAICVGSLALTFYAFSTGPFPDFSAASAKSILALLYLGPIGTTLSYVIWMRVVQTTPVALPALTLFIQPLFGTFLGFAFRGESFGATQSIGAFLILIAVAAQSLWEYYAPLRKSS